MNNTFKINTEAKNYSKLFYVIYGDQTVNDGDFFPLDAVQRAPLIRFDRMGNANKGKFHTIIIVDPDAPVGFHVHLCLYDIPGDNMNYGKVFYGYSPPNPPAGSGPERDGKHRYYCILYEQTEKIDKELVGEQRGFKKYDDFRGLLGVGLNPKASKYFVCQYGRYL